jgi:lipoprotein NlpD
MNPMNRLHLDARTLNTSNVRITVLQRIVCVLALSALAACATRLDNAPVVDRSVNAAPAPLGPPPPGYYRVKPGDTLYRIALENGQNYRDIATWNNLTNPNQIEVDQLLRVAPPGSNPTLAGTGVSSAPVTIGSGVQSAPLGGGNPQTNVPLGSLPPAAPLTSMPAPLASIPPTPAPGSAMPNAVEGLSLIWPARGPIINRFDDVKNKGVDIGGALGDPVRAAADGRVVYAGSGLRGYGNLIIVKHDATFLTAYAHNQTLLVKEGDAVTRGQNIATMGNSDADRVMLHFEVRKQGKPVDPLKYLPPQ